VHKQRCWKDQNRLVEVSLVLDKLSKQMNSGQMNRGRQGILRTDE